MFTPAFRRITTLVSAAAVVGTLAMPAIAPAQQSMSDAEIAALNCGHLGTSCPEPAHKPSKKAHAAKAHAAKKGSKAHAADKAHAAHKAHARHEGRAIARIAMPRD